MEQDRAARAAAYFRQGYNCAQAVLLAYADETGFSREVSARLASSFGGGMGRLREVCGALSAAFMIVGLRSGCDDPSDPDAKAAHYARVQALAASFAAQNGSILCRELLRLGEGADSPVPSARTAAYYAQRPCEALVACAARLVQDGALPQPDGEEASPPQE